MCPMIYNCLIWLAVTCFMLHLGALDFFGGRLHRLDVGTFLPGLGTNLLELVQICPSNKHLTIQTSSVALDGSGRSPSCSDKKKTPTASVVSAKKSGAPGSPRPNPNISSWIQTDPTAQLWPTASRSKAPELQGHQKASHPGDAVRLKKNRFFGPDGSQIRCYATVALYCFVLFCYVLNDANSGVSF